MRIDVKGFVQWGCVSDIPLASMDCVKYPDYYIKGDLIFYCYMSWSCNIISLYNLTVEHRYFPYWLCDFPLVHNGCLCGSPTLPLTCIGYFAGLCHSGGAFFKMFLLFISLLCDL